MVFSFEFLSEGFADDKKVMFHMKTGWHATNGTNDEHHVA